MIDAFITVTCKIILTFFLMYLHTLKNFTIFWGFHVLDKHKLEQTVEWKRRTASPQHDAAITKFRVGVR